MRKTLSVVIIVKNEEKYIGKCIDSVKDIADEIIVVDTGSTDNTCDIVRSKGIEPYFHEWRDNFSEAKNFAISHATCDWILNLDADEELMEEGKKELIKILENDNTDVVGYLIPILCPTNYDNGLTRINWFIRLFRNHIGATFQGRVHEQIFYSIKDKGDIVSAPVYLYHYGYMKDDKTMREKAYRNYVLLKKDIEENPLPISHYHLGEAAMLLGKFEEAEKHYKIAIEKEDDNRIKSLVCSSYAEILYRKRNLDEAIKYLYRAIELNPLYLAAYVKLGLYLYENKNFDEALEILNEVEKLSFRIKSEGILPTETNDVNWVSRLIMGNIYAQEGNFEKAEYEYNMALVRCGKDDVRILWPLALVLLKQSKFEEADSIYEKIYDTFKDNAEYYYYRSIVSLGLNDVDRSSDFIQKCEKLGYYKDKIDTIKNIINQRKNVYSS